MTTALDERIEALKGSVARLRLMAATLEACRIKPVDTLMMIKEMERIISDLRARRHRR